MSCCCEKRKITAEDLYSLTFLGDPQISPDGKQIAYVQTRIDKDSKEYRSQIYTVGACGCCEPSQFTGGPKSDSTPRWSPDGNWLAFVSDRGGDRQIWLMKRGGGEARQLTTMRYGAGNPVWSPDSKKIAFVARMGKNDSYEAMLAPRKKDEKDAEEKKAKDSGRVIDSIRYKSNDEGYLTDRKSQIWVMDIEGGKPVQITTGQYDNGGVAWSPDGEQLVFSSNRSEDPAMTPITDLWLVSAQGGEIKKLTKSTGMFGMPAWSPCGKQIAYFGNNREFAGATLSRLWVVDVDGGEPRCLTEKFDRSMGDQGMNDLRGHLPIPGPVWANDGKSIFVPVSDKGNTHMFSVCTKSGEVTQLTTGRRQIFNYAFAPDQSYMAIIYTDPVTPNELSVISMADKAEKRLTDSNAEFLKSVAISAPEEFWFKGVDNWDIQGWMMKPIGYQAGKKYPMVLEIHGGPHAMYSNSFFMEFQLLAAHGYAVLFSNPRGGHGYGQEFVHACVGDYGGKDYGDLMASVDYALATYDFIDENRLGVTGGSYGGFMTNWVVGHTDRFKAAVTQRCISNWISFFGVSDIGYTFTENEHNVTPFNGFDKLIFHSPLTYVENIKTPLLILHGETDYRCPLEQAEQLFVSLKKLGRETQMVIFPQSTHELSRSGKPVLRVERLNRIVGYFDDHIERNSEDYCCK